MESDAEGSHKRAETGNLQEGISMSGIDSDELSQVVDRIDEAGKSVFVYLDETDKIRTKVVTSANKVKFMQEGYKIVGVYTMAVSFKDLKADVEYVRAM